MEWDWQSSSLPWSGQGSLGLSLHGERMLKEELSQVHASHGLSLACQIHAPRPRAMSMCRHAHGAGLAVSFCLGSSCDFNDQFYQLG